jgi:hypothetical protein
VGVRSAVDVSEIHASHLQDSEGGEHMYLRNVGKAAHIHTVQRPKSRINMSYGDRLKSVKTILTDTNPALQTITLSYAQYSRFHLPLFPYGKEGKTLNIELSKQTAAEWFVLRVRGRHWVTGRQ